MKKAILAAVAMVMMIASNSNATEPTSTWIGVGGYSSGSTTTMNLTVRFLDASSNMIFEPATMVQVWARFKSGTSCGGDNATATVVLHNGISVQMKKDLDYTFFVPMIWADWTVTVTTNISESNFLGTCFSIEGYGPTGQSLPGGY